VFDSIVRAAVRSLRCDMAAVLLRDGDVYDHKAASTPLGPMNLPAGRPPIDPSANFPSRAILAKETLHLPDWSEIDLPEHERSIEAALGVHSALYLPLVREGECIGVLVALGSRAHAFGPKEIAQAESFRDQALIAIENARLFNETKEALERQTATADVLKIISRSAFDLQTVFDTLLASAAELLGAIGGALSVRQGEEFGFRSTVSANPVFMRLLGRSMPVDRLTAAGRALLSGKTELIADMEADPEFRNPLPEFPARSALAVPLKRGDRIAQGGENLALGHRPATSVCRGTRGCNRLLDEAAARLARLRRRFDRQVDQIFEECVDRDNAMTAAHERRDRVAIQDAVEFGRSPIGEGPHLRLAQYGVFLRDASPLGDKTFDNRALFERRVISEQEGPREGQREATRLRGPHPMHPMSSGLSFLQFGPRSRAAIPCAF
jgi:GAF domain-containing protein